jgi:hypothetical protein
MHRSLLFAALMLYLSGAFASARERYGAWLLICEQGDHPTLVAILVPFDGTFENWRDVVPVLIRRGSDNPFDLLQKWKNGKEYIFLDTKDEVRELASFLKAEETGSEKSTHFYFLKDANAGLQNANHIVVDVWGFSGGFDVFQKTCASVR